MTLADEVALPGHPRADARPMCVLVVDDEPALRRFVARILVEEGYVVLEAGNGAEAIERVSATGSTIDVVVSDIVMPGINGIELIRRLAEIHPDLPVVLMSGYGTAQLTDRGITTACAVLAKPFSRERLVDEVKRCLSIKA